MVNQWLTDSTQQMIAVMEAHHNLLGAIRNTIRDLPIKIPLKHVKGYQDNGTPTALNRDTWMNIQVDALAKSRIGEQPHNTQTTSKILGKQWSCYIEGEKVVKNMEKQICYHINSKLITNYWRENHTDTYTSGLGHNGKGDGEKYTQTKMVGSTICNGFLCPWTKYELLEFMNSNRMPAMPGRQ